MFTYDSLIGFIFLAEAFKSNVSSSPKLSTVDEKIELILDFLVVWPRVLQLSLGNLIIDRTMNKRPYSPFDYVL